MSTPGTKSNGHLLALGLALALLFGIEELYERRHEGVGDALELMVRGDFEEALQEFELLQRRSKGGAEAVRWEAICLLALNEQPKAVRTLKEGIVKFPEEHSLSVVLAEVYLSLGQSQLAVPVLLDARERGASDRVISVTMAVCHGHARSFDRALEELARAERGGASATDVGYNRSLILMEEGRPDEARDILEAVLDQSGEHLAALREHARALVMTSEGEQDERLVQAITQVNRVLEIRTGDWRAYEVLGDAFLAQADPIAAISAYSEALRFGRNPIHIEDKYREAAVRARHLHGDAVEIPAVRPANPIPPMPPSMEGLEELLRMSRG